MPKYIVKAGDRYMEESTVEAAVALAEKQAEPNQPAEVYQRVGISTVRDNSAERPQ